MKKLGLAVAVLLSACPKERTEAFDESDPLIRKLKAEKARGPTATSPAEPVTNKLAEAAVNGAAPRALTVDTATVFPIGDVDFKLVSATVTQSVTRNGMTVSTADAFIKVTLSATTKKAQALNLSAFTLTQKADTFSVPKDIQKIGQGSPMELELKADEENQVTVFFEAPGESIGPGLTLNLVTASARGTLRLQ